MRNGGDDLRRCLLGLEQQDLRDELEVIVLDSESSDGSAELARTWGARTYTVPAAEFHHGRTRNLGARLAGGEILVFTTQDAYADRRDWLSLLTAPLRGDGDLAGVYGRQVAKPHAIPPERYFLEFLYGEEPREQRARDETELTMETTLFSNVNSAIRRTVWERFPFAEDVIMGEDQEWCARVLLAGYVVRYEPRAVVRHSHDYGLWSAFRRFFDSGVSAERSYLRGQKSSARVLRGAALAYALGELGWLWQTRQRRWIPYAVVYELSKLGGLWLGKHHRALPPWLKRRISAYPRHFGENR